MNYEVKSKRVLLVVGFVVALAGILFLAFTGDVVGKGEYRPPPPKAKRVSLKGLRVRDPAKGQGKRVVLVSSPACPACRAYVPKLLDKAKEIALYYKPVRYGKGNEDLQRAMECVRQQKTELFWEFVRLCYSRPELALGWLGQKTSPGFVQSCLADEGVAQALHEDEQEVRSIGVRAIPAVIVGERLYQGGIAIERVLLKEG